MPCKSIESEKALKEIIVDILNDFGVDLIMKLVNVPDSHTFAEIENLIREKYPKLNYLNDINLWSKISRFSNSAPRDQNLATSAVDSLNAAIKNIDLKASEPLDVFQYIYEFGFFSLKKISCQKTFISYSVSE